MPVLEADNNKNNNYDNMNFEYEIIDVNWGLCNRFIDDVLMEHFPRNYLNRYRLMCYKNRSPILGYILVEGITNVMLGGVLVRAQKSKGIINYKDDVFYIEMLAIKSQFTRQGLAKELLNEIEGLSKHMKIKRVELHVSMSNIVALQFYYKHGFKMETVKKDFYSNVVDYQGSKTALLLVKRLDI